MVTPIDAILLLLAEASEATSRSFCPTDARITAASVLADAYIFLLDERFRESA